MIDGAIKILICNPVRLSVNTARALMELVRAATVQPNETIVVGFPDRIRIERMLDRIVFDDLRLPDFSKELKRERVQRLSTLERVQLQHHEPRVKPRSPRNAGHDIRRFIPRRTR